LSLTVLAFRTAETFAGVFSGWKLEAAASMI
jgi:hypothetical protein